MFCNKFIKTKLYIIIQLAFDIYCVYQIELKSMIYHFNIFSLSYFFTFRSHAMEHLVKHRSCGEKNDLGEMFMFFLKIRCVYKKKKKIRFV